MLVRTIGHGTRPLEELVATLAEARVETLVDVRRFPGSRRNPQFGREPLEAALAAAGIGYRHAVELGGRPPPGSRGRPGAWCAPSRSGGPATAASSPSSSPRGATGSSTSSAPGSR